MLRFGEDVSDMDHSAQRISGILLPIAPRRQPDGGPIGCEANKSTFETQTRRLTKTSSLISIVLEKARSLQVTDQNPSSDGLFFRNLGTCKSESESWPP